MMPSQESIKETLRQVSRGKWRIVSGMVLVKLLKIEGSQESKPNNSFFLKKSKIGAYEEVVMTGA